MNGTLASTGYCLGEILHRLDDPVFLIDARREVLFHNHAAIRILSGRSGIHLQAGRLAFQTPANNLLLEQILEQQLRHADASSHGLRSSRKSASRDWLITISSVPLNQLSSSRIFIVHLVSRLTLRHLPHAALEHLFGLAHQEIAVVTRLAQQQSLRQIAEQMHLSHETIRAYLKRIFRKCGVYSQQELLSLLQRLALFAK